VLLVLFNPLANTVCKVCHASNWLQNPPRTVPMSERSILFSIKNFFQWCPCTSSFYTLNWLLLYIIWVSSQYTWHRRVVCQRY